MRANERKHGAPWLTGRYMSRSDLIADISSPTM
jgi:hypothetical protein